MEGMVTLMLQSKIQLAACGYLKKNNVDPSPLSSFSYKVPQLQRVKLLHPVERNGEPAGYLW